MTTLTSFTPNLNNKTISVVESRISCVPTSLPNCFQVNEVMRLGCDVCKFYCY
jgi:hypothetical protein